MSWGDLLEAVARRFRAAPVQVRADFLIDVAHELELFGDEAALRKRSYEEAEKEWKIH